MATPVQLELDFGPYVLDPPRVHVPLKTFCDGMQAAAWRHTSDEYRCGKCGIIWGIDEPRPPCNTDAS